MDQKSQLKVIREGFQIVRPDDQPSPRIKMKNKLHHDWVTLEKFETKVARDRKLAEFLKLNMIIQD
jgi:hypothetical protein